jgi:hemoglobin
MLRARHLRFVIDERARDAWLQHMGDALDPAAISADDRDELWRYFVQAANFFMNQGGLSFSGR